VETLEGLFFLSLINNSQVDISNWKFNNNNGLQGGLFYINGNSPVYVTNSSFFNNFALVAPISYTTNQGSIHFIDWDFIFNHALSVGLFELIDSIVESSIEHWNIHQNQLVDKATIIAELDDRSHCRNLCFASESYYLHLSNHRNLLDFVVKLESLI